MTHFSIEINGERRLYSQNSPVLITSGEGWGTPLYLADFFIITQQPAPLGRVDPHSWAPANKNHSPLHCASHSAGSGVWAHFLSDFQKHWKEKYLLWGSPLLLLWHKGSVQIIGFQELFSGLPLTFALKVSCNEVLLVR